MNANHESRGLADLLLPGLVFGFATAVAMWLVGFLTHVPGLRVSAPVAGALLLGAQGVGSILAGRSGARGGGVPMAILAGLVTGAINLLIVGSVVASDATPNDLRPGWAMIAAGSLGFGALAGLVGGVLGRAMGARRPASNPSRPTQADWLGRFGVVAVCSAIPVLLSGGLVTSTGTGLAVPDWPTSYNANMFLYPLSKMTGGIYYEHAHRLFGSLVGFTVLVLCALTLVIDRRGAARALAVACFVFVCAQGVLGGVRVTSATDTGAAPSPQTLADNSTSLVLAMVHGITAQLFFALLCVCALVLSRSWRMPPDLAPRSGAHADVLLRRGSLALVCALALQLVLGSATRHLHQMHAVWTHVFFAAVVIALAAGVGFRAAARHRQDAVLRRLGFTVAHSVGLQALLGLGTLFAVLPQYSTGASDPAYAVVLATAHQLLGAILLGSSAALAVWVRRTMPAAPTAGEGAPDAP